VCLTIPSGLKKNKWFYFSSISLAESSSLKFFSAGRAGKPLPAPGPWAESAIPQARGQGMGCGMPIVPVPPGEPHTMRLVSEHHGLGPLKAGPRPFKLPSQARRIRRRVTGLHALHSTGAGSAAGACAALLYPLRLFIPSVLWLPFQLPGHPNSDPSRFANGCSRDAVRACQPPSELKQVSRLFHDIDIDA
jgi:hypothetical protein